MNKPLMILVLMVCLVSSVWAEKEGDADQMEYTGDSFGNRAIWANHWLWEGNATLREIDIGTKIKGVTDDTIRLFTVQSASPRQALLFTDTSSSTPRPLPGFPRGRRGAGGVSWRRWPAGARSVYRGGGTFSPWPRRRPGRPRSGRARPWSFGGR